MLELKITANDPNEILQIAGIISAVAAAQQRQRVQAAPVPEPADPPVAETASEDAPKSEQPAEVNPSGQRKARKPRVDVQKRLAEDLEAAKKSATITTEPAQTDIEDAVKAEPPKELTFDDVKTAMLEHCSKVRERSKDPESYRQEVFAVMSAAKVPGPKISAIVAEHFAPIVKIVGALSEALKGFEGDDKAWSAKRDAVIAGIVG